MIGLILGVVALIMSMAALLMSIQTYREAKALKEDCQAKDQPSRIQFEDQPGRVPMPQPFPRRPLVPDEKPDSEHKIAWEPEKKEE